MRDLDFSRGHDRKFDHGYFVILAMAMVKNVDHTTLTT